MLNPDVTQTRPLSNERLPDVRDIVDYADRIGQLARIDGADWNIEIGVLAEIFAHSNPGRSPAVLFDRIKDYPPGMRIVSGLHNSCRRVAFSFGFPDSDDPTTLVKAYRDRMKGDFKLIPPVAVTGGPILENVDRDDAVDLFKFPVPMIHEKDGGRYIGTYCVVIMRDPDTGWVNLGTYRTVAHDKQNAGVWISPGKHGRLIREKYFKQGKPCPVLICCGLDPVLFLAGSHEIKHGTTEYAYAGGHRGRPYETIASELHGLPMPANAEIVLEGTIEAEAKSSKTQDEDRNGSPELVLRFPIDALRGGLEQGMQTLTVTGSLSTGETFSGSDEVRIINPPAGQAAVHPNPLNPEGTLRFHLASGGPVRARLFDVNGRLVRTLIAGLLLPLVGAEPVAERVVVDRNRITGGGVTAGIDFGLTLLAVLAGDEVAQSVQLGLEYDPQPPFQSGSPEKAGPVRIARVRAQMEKMIARRLEANARAAARMA
jgi:hypothetical protein